MAMKLYAVLEVKDWICKRLTLLENKVTNHRPDLSPTNQEGQISIKKPKKLQQSKYVWLIKT